MMVMVMVTRRSSIVAVVVVVWLLLVLFGRHVSQDDNWRMMMPIIQLLVGCMLESTLEGG